MNTDVLTELLPDSLLDTFRARADGYDERNEFFTQDLADLREAGYLRLLVPQEFGGLGATLTTASAAQRRLASAAPATALGINMHHVIVGMAYTLYLRGDRRLNWVFEAAAKGEVFAFGISEAGNDSVLFDATTSAEPVADGFQLSGTKIFTSLAPVWDHLLVHARTTAAADDPQALVFGFLDRDEERIEVKDDWNTLGMRASQSRTTVLKGAHLPASRIAAFTPTGPNPEPLVWGIFGVFELLLASVYTGIGERAVERAVQIVGTRMSKAKGKPYAQDPDIRWQLAEAAIGLDGAKLQLAQLLAGVDAVGTDAEPGYGPAWFLYFSGVKGRCTEAAKTAVELALRTTGGAQYFRGSELERLYRDVLAGLYHPSDNESLHAAYARALLGDLEP